jgi:hypothetical protein
VTDSADDYRVAVNLRLWDSGCLPGLIRKEIAAVERSIRVHSSSMPEDAHANHTEYLNQLKGCLAAVEEGRHQAVTPIAV